MKTKTVFKVLTILFIILAFINFFATFSLIAIALALLTIAEAIAEYTASTQAQDDTTPASLAGSKINNHPEDCFCNECHDDYCNCPMCR